MRLALLCYNFVYMSEQKQAVITFLNHYLSIATLLGFVVCIIWLFGIVFFLNAKKEVRLFSVIAKYALPLGFFSTFFSTLMSLYYSDYLGVLPCGLCWFQRVFIYPQVFLFALAWYRKDLKIFLYSTVLSLVGIIIATYHEYLQLGYSELVPCPTIASTIDCAKPTFIEFGFITFPFMAFVLFAFLILLSLTVNNFAKHHN